MTSDDKDQLWSEATLWFARMRSPDAEAFRPQFEQWLARGALHRRYYNRASEYWVDSGSALAENADGGAGDGRDQASAERRSTHRTLAALGAGLLLAAGSTALWLGHWHESGSPASLAGAAQGRAQDIRYATAADEQRLVRLADGSLVSLAGGSDLRVQFAADVRRLDLEQGAARFDVAHERRPFVVLAGGGSVTAHGTLFEVGLSRNGRVSVRLIRGSIDVRFPAAARAPDRPPPRRLRPGETVSFDALVTKPRVGAVAAAAAPAEAARDYRNVRLGDLIREANRPGAVPIRLADPATAARTVSGRFRIDDTSLLAERIADLFDLVVDRSDPAEIVLRSKPTGKRLF